MFIEREIEKSRKLLISIAKIGKKFSSKHIVNQLFPFRHYFDNNGNLIKNSINDNDGLWTRREILTRFLFIRAVLDQGPDLEGVGILTTNVINALYKKEIRILHKPLDFFKELEISIDEILEKHEGVKKIRAEEWARLNKSTANRYNIFTDGTKQVLGYAIYRWGVPLCVPFLLEKDYEKIQKQSCEPLVEFIEQWDSSEIMSKEIKSNERYGLGKAIGDKAGHLFAKWYIHTFKLVKKKEKSWGNLSYELPFDSNAGRILFRTGFLFDCANESEYEDWDVIQKGKGKEGKHYIRVTNIRGKKSEKLASLKNFMDSYTNICIEYLKARKRKPSTVEIQQILNVLLLDTDYGIGDLDDGLINIGIHYCFNHGSPKCIQCPIQELCEGYNINKNFITDYRT